MTGPYWWINLAEAALWAALAAVVMIVPLRRGRPLGLQGTILGVALIAFALSDIVETQTGAWWRPWWLLVWKAACVVVLGTWFIAWATRRRTLRADLDRPHQQAAPPVADPASPAPR